MTTTLATGKSLSAFLEALVEDSVKSALYQKSLQEKDKQDAASGGQSDSSGGDGDGGDDLDLDGDDDGEEDDHSSKTMEDDKEELESGDIDASDVIEKLNSIRSGHSFRDSKVKDNMQRYVDSLSAAEKTALLAFLKGISQIVTGEIPAPEATTSSGDPADVKMKKGPEEPKVKHLEPNVIKASSPKKNKGPGEEDSSGPVPITPKRKK